MKNIPGDSYDLHKLSAIAIRLSINNELIVCLEKHFLPQRFSVDGNLNRIPALRKRANARKISAKEIANAKQSDQSAMIIVDANMISYLFLPTGYIKDSESLTEIDESGVHHC